MKYTDESKDAVQHKSMYIPRGHRLWIELGIDKAEEGGEIDPYIEPLPSAADKIAELEAKVTPRRSREAMLTGDYSFIRNIEEQIKALSVRK